MRLIDADALEKSLCTCCTDNPCENQCLYVTILRTAPTIEAEPVRHGKLLRTDAYPHRLYCSKCSRTLIPNEETCFEKNEFPKWCMWCGATMDLEEEE